MDEETTTWTMTLMDEETTTWTMTWTEFLLARIAEDEVTETHVDRRYLGAGRWTEKVSHSPPSARMLAECKAKRRIIQGWGQDEELMQVLALVYADHPDYHAIREGS